MSALAAYLYVLGGVSIYVLMVVADDDVTPRWQLFIAAVFWPVAVPAFALFLAAFWCVIWMPRQ
jgi:hypothetical protein